MSRRSHAGHPRWTAAGLSAAALLAVAACASNVSNPVGAGGASSPATPTASSTARSGTSSAPSAPLTDLPAGSAAAAARPAVALVVSGSDPEGLGSADVVFEEISAPVRYIAVFQSRPAAAVGPLTGTQPTDGEVLSVLHPLIGYDGGTPIFVKILDATRVTDAGYARYASLYSATADGVATSPQAISQAVHGTGAPPQLYRYRGAEPGDTTLAATGVSRPTSVHVAIPGAGTQVWVFDSSADRWTLTSGGPRVQVANLVVQTVPYENLYVSHRYGITVPSARVIGSGRATVFSGSIPGSGGGTAASGTWSKPHIEDLTNFFGADGSPMAFQPGPTWVILAPSGTQISASGG